MHFRIIRFYLRIYISFNTKVTALDTKAEHQFICTMFAPSCIDRTTEPPNDNTHSLFIRKTFFADSQFS